MRMYLKTRLFWNWSIRALLESYSIVTICAMINILDVSVFTLTHTLIFV